MLFLIWLVANRCHVTNAFLQHCAELFFNVFTEAKTFSGQIRITNRDFEPEYNNKSSEAFKDFEKEFIEEVSYPELFK